MQVTVHATDTVRGCPAEGLRFRLSCLNSAGAEVIEEFGLDANGHASVQLPQECDSLCQYRLTFKLIDCFKSQDVEVTESLFTQQVSLELGFKQQKNDAILLAGFQENSTLLGMQWV